MSFVSTEIIVSPRVKKVLNNLPQTATDLAKKDFLAAANKVKDRIMADAPVFDSGLKNSVSVKEIGDLNIEIVSSMHYAPYVEFGTKKNARIPAHLSQYASQFQGKSDVKGDPIAALTNWVNKKGLAKKVAKTDRFYRIKGKRSNRKQREEAIAWLIFRKIMRDGLKPQPFFFSDKQGRDRTGWIQELFRNALEKALQRLL